MIGQKLLVIACGNWIFRSICQFVVRSFSGPFHPGQKESPQTTPDNSNETAWFSLRFTRRAFSLFPHVSSAYTVVKDPEKVNFSYRDNLDLLVGLGGGSSMDCAKGINFLYSCGGEMQDYWGVGKASSEMLPMIAVPTTAGTGINLI